MRVGPSRLTSTALSSGESKATVAAEWITMSQPASVGPVGLVEAEAVGADVAGDRAHTARRHLVERRARPSVGAQAVEGVVAEDLPLDPLRGGGAAPGPHQQHQLAVRHLAEQPLDEGGADEAGRAGDGDALAGQRLGDHGGRCGSRASVYPRLSTIW